MTITVSVPDQLAAHAESLGLSVEALVERLAKQVLDTEPKHDWVRFGPGPLTPEEAADDIRDLRRGLTLGGLTFKDLISEGRKY